MINSIKLIYIIIIFLLTVPVLASSNLDTDKDGITNYDELNIYKTDTNNPDTDGDGYSDWLELNSGYSPHNPLKIKLEDNDFDNDGLNDRMELNFYTDLSEPDTDGDGYSDGMEIQYGYDPLSKGVQKMAKRIEVSTKNQELSYFLNGIRVQKMVISSGVGNSTPMGTFYIDDKKEKAWSSYGLWMPYWLSFKNGIYGIHELPIWPSGKQEGEDHLGTPASHGCVRLGENDAKKLFKWTDLGTPVIIY
jgi:hypothetical protein